MECLKSDEDKLFFLRHVMENYPYKILGLIGRGYFLVRGHDVSNTIGLGLRQVRKYKNSLVAGIIFSAFLVVQ